MTRKDKTYKLIEVSKETYDFLSKLQDLAEQIFNKKKISFDKLIFWLLKTKVDWVDLIGSCKIDKPETSLS